MEKNVVYYIKEVFMKKLFLKIFISVIMVLIGWLLLSCEINVQVEFDQKTFNKQRKLWQESNIKNYQYHFSASGFMGYHGLVSVENGMYKNDPTSDEYSEDRDLMNSFPEYSTIDKVYETIEKHFKDTNNTKQSIGNSYLKKIDVEYDKVNHIPKKIYYDYYVPPMVVVDGTFHYDVEDFKKLD
jgi:hypothetical protein